MFRKILMVAPLLAFALPFAVTSPSSARPLATPVDEAEFCWGDCEDGGDSIELQVCVEVQLKVDREYECGIQQGPACLANCTAEAVTPLCLNELGDRPSPRALADCQGARAATCRAQCDGDGAAFCSDGLRWDGDDDDDDDDHDGGSNLIFIDVDVCVWLEINH